ncbi:hypothetical protein VDR43_09140 [Xanthomonas campestris pv. campestris]|nr:hypothetical protein [Xanthomonas campestris pv. campestris]
MALMVCPFLGSRRNQTEPAVNRISEVLLDLLIGFVRRLAVCPQIDHVHTVPSFMGHARLVPSISAHAG